ncbi:MAG TPA: hypothetical protein VN690_10635 [Terriglobales bacterium]|nr:hypothetical protein [Terriglobales bacterium]
MAAEGAGKPELKRALEALLEARGLRAALAGAARAPVEADARGALTPPAAGAITEVVGRAGATSLALHWAATCPGQIAWVDASDRLDPEGAARAGVELTRLLWVRGAEEKSAAVPALRAAQLLLRAGGFALVVLDLRDLGAVEAARATWFRLLRGLERERRTALVVLAQTPLAGPCADRVLSARHARRQWNQAGELLLEGARLEVETLATRRNAFAGKRPPERVAEIEIELSA